MGPRGRSLRRPLLTGLTAAGILLAAFVPAASAHVQLVGSDPADATSLSSVPRQIHLRFNEELSSRFRQVRLLDAHGRPVPGTSTTAGDGGRSLTLTLPPALPRGAYEVTWEALSKSDGHVSGGALVLGLGAVVGPPVVAAPAAGVKTFDAILRWALLSVLLWLIGVVGMTAVLLRARFPEPEGPGSRDRALRRVVGSIAPVAAIGAAVGLAILVREAVARCPEARGSWPRSASSSASAGGCSGSSASWRWSHWWSGVCTSAAPLRPSAHGPRSPSPRSWC